MLNFSYDWNAQQARFIKKKIESVISNIYCGHLSWFPIQPTYDFFGDSAFQSYFWKKKNYFMNELMTTVFLDRPLATPSLIRINKCSGGNKA